MKRSTLLALGAIATLGLAAVAVPVIAQQGMGQHGGPGMMGGMMGDHQGMMGEGAGMMGGQNSYAMRNFDADGDGTLSAEEMAAGMAGELATYDTDGNGSLSLDEFAAMRAIHTRRMTVRAFQMHDTDGDGQVTQDEMTEMLDMMQQRMGAGGMMGMGQPGMGRGKMMNNN
ncbi:MAG: EF-hand domain-containing protein [Pseudorhodobacter sp.]|nr:EF-hand domain-containing protein [Pseudorhodobacter sp.]